MLFYFTDPVLKAPVLASIFMCLSTALMGVFVFLQKRSLLSESLSHATYPGVIIGGAIASFFFKDPLLGILGGAFIASFLGLILIDQLIRKRVSEDASLCFILSGFFSFGLLFASRLQITKTALYKQLQIYLFGQTATMVDHHITIYAGLSLLIVFFILSLFRPLQLYLFDPAYARGIGVKTHLLKMLLSFLLVLSIIIGIRSVGIVLMSGMLIAPAIAARAFTNRLAKVFLLAALFGACFGFFGNVISYEISKKFFQRGGTLPTGPVIVLVGISFALFSLIFSPKRGAAFRFFRIVHFKMNCIEENILKSIYKLEVANFRKIKSHYHISRFTLFFLLKRLLAHGFIQKGKAGYTLTLDGEKKALRIIRFHRLWEVYLTEYMGLSAEKVHCSAEEMEHIITPEIEKKLTALLSDPKTDPHKQPIPERPVSI